MPILDDGVKAIIRTASASLEREPAGIPQEQPDFEEIARMRQELAEQTARNALLELEQIKKLLSEQDAARKHAQKTAAHAHRQLKLYEADGNRLRGELQRTQEQLSLSKHEHNEEIRRAALRESTITAELVEARHRVSGVVAAAGDSRKKWRTVSLVVAFCALGWLGFTRLKAGPATEATKEPDPVAGSFSSQKPASAAPSVIAPGDISGALGSLDDALGYFKGMKPEEVLRIVHKENAARGVSVCSFEWNGGQVSLVFGSGGGNDPQVAVQQCADAVRKSAAGK
jgi:hypothetical protein